MKKIQLLLCVADKSFIKTITESVYETDDIKICGVVDNEHECITLCDKVSPDIVLLDIDVFNINESCIIENIYEHISIKSKLIAITSREKEYISNIVVKYKLEFCFKKPVDIYPLLERFRDFGGVGTLSQLNIKQYIRSFLLHIGIQINWVAFVYIIDSVMLLQKINLILFVTKDVYPYVAKLHNTSSVCVEKAIRKAVSDSFNKNPELFMKELSVDKKPSNNVFLRLIVELVEEHI